MAEYSVLIIDDDVWMQRILSKTMQSYGFNKSYLASNGFEGIAMAVEHQPDVIILDILMPELSGHLTLKILKSIKLTRDIPVLMVSALSDVENLGLAVKSGTAGFISKPFTRATVYEKLIKIYGKEELDMIQRGESIKDAKPYPEEGDAADEDGFKMSGRRKSDQSESDGDDINSDKDKSKPKVSQDQLLQHYQDEEKKSIESIKKLLLKTRK